MNRLRWNYLFTKNSLLAISKNFLIAFGSIWLLIECPSALNGKVKDFVDAFGPWFLLAALCFSLLIAIYKAFPRFDYTRKFKSTQTSITLKVGDLLNEKGNIVIGSSDYFDFDYNNLTGVSLKSQLMSNIFKNDIAYVNSLVQKSLVGLEKLAVIDEQKPYGNKLRYPIGTVVVLPQADRKIFTLALTKLTLKGNEKHTQSDPLTLNEALVGLWKKIEVEGRKKKFSAPILGAGLANVNLSYLLTIQSIIISYAIYSRNSNISKEMTLIISPDDYNPEDFEEAIQFLNSIQI